MKLRELLVALKSSPCVDCNLNYPSYVMDFDHVRGTKIRGVSQMLRYGEKAVLEEVAKCELVCANCHRARTHTRKL